MCAATDTSGGLLLAWRQASEAGWRLSYTRVGSPPPAGKLPVELPSVDLGHPEADDLYALGHPDGSVWLLWAFRAPVAPGQTRWRLAYRRLPAGAAALPQAAAWQAPVTLTAADALDDEREPAALPAANGAIELFWSGTRTGSWEIWRGDLAPAAAAPVTPQRLTPSPAADRAPAPFNSPSGTLLVYRSNESLKYTSPTYGATTTLDTRYTGSVSVDTRNLALIGRQGSYTDTQAYSYDTRRVEAAWYARDTVGIYLRPAVASQQEIVRGRKLIEGIIRRFMPIQVRVVFIIEQPTYDEAIYPDQRPLEERITDRVQIPSAESYSGATDSYSDRAPGWRYLKTWSEGRDGGRSADTRRTPPDGGRSWLAGVEEGG
jgi:hypothetical protein